ncbi:MAG: lysophospholipase [Rhodobacteraceae bacterium]|nr:lysophospholipase [Paracoccaceae bacterium]
MIKSDAPFFSKVAMGPPGGFAKWLSTEDDKKIRLGIWRNGRKGTVLIFPGRGEFIEKYGAAADLLSKKGYSVMAIDWRGQGLSDRLHKNHFIGHIKKYSDYQKDVRATLQAFSSLELPKPLYLLSHSMGGCIAMRSLIEKLPFTATVFTSPMWGLSISPFVQLLSKVVEPIARMSPLSTKIVPGGSTKNYVIYTPFEKNVLTNSQNMYGRIKNQLNTYPELMLGSPTIGWINESLKECRLLENLSAPPVPSLVLVGSNESIIDTNAIRKRISKWDNGKLITVQNAKHELIMEVKKVRDQTINLIDNFFNKNT